MTGLIVIVAMLLLWLITGYICLKKACGRGSELDVTNPRHIRGTQMEVYHQPIMAGVEWLRRHPGEQLWLTSRDGLRLTARLITQDDPQQARGTIICMHGYRSCINDFSGAAPLYFQQGFNLLMVTQRSHGQSEGKYICFGAAERFDCADWAKLITARFPDLPIFLTGISMGAATVLMAAGVPLPDNVRGIVADCGFTSAREIIGKELYSRYHVPGWLLLSQLGLMARLAGHFSLRVSTVEAMRKNRLPVLFIHGEADKFVPAWMTQAAYEACTADKELVLVPGAEHAMSFMVDNPRVSAALLGFLDRLS